MSLIIKVWKCSVYCNNFPRGTVGITPTTHIKMKKTLPDTQNTAIWLDFGLIAIGYLEIP